MSRDDLSRSEPVSSEVRKLIDAALNGAIDEAGLRELDGALLNQPAVQSFFLEYCQLHIDLMIDTRAGQVMDEFRQRRQRATPIPPLGLEESSPLAPTSPPSVTGFLPWFAGGGAMLGLSLLAVAVFWFWSASPAPVQLAEPARTNLPSIQLLAGTAKVTLPNIGHVIVDGPAEFEMLDPMRARLKTGRIKMRVTEETGHGFVVETPYGRVTDLGTEFGLDVPLDGSKAGLVVFDGEVDLEVNSADDEKPEPGKSPRLKRLAQGDGVTFDHRGQVERINSVVTGNTATFQQTAEAIATGQSSLIASVRDNRRTSESNKFYEIVPGGLKEDVNAYVDRVHQWNGISKDGMPSYLVGADYVKTFNADNQQQHLNISVVVVQPAKLYVFWDGRLKPPEWLKKSFRDTGDKIGLDAGPWSKKTKERKLGVGAGESVEDQFTVWERTVTEPATVVLEANVGESKTSIPAMYGIAATAIASADAAEKVDASVTTKQVATEK